MPRSRARKRLTQDEVELVRQLAGVQMSRREVERALGWWSDEAQETYDAARIEAEATVRDAVRRMALAGSGPAQTLYVELTRQRAAGSPDSTSAEIEARREMARMRGVGYSYSDLAAYLGELLEGLSPTDPAFARILKQYAAALERASEREPPPLDIQIVIVAQDDPIPPPPEEADAGEGE